MKSSRFGSLADPPQKQPTSNPSPNVKVQISDDEIPTNAGQTDGFDVDAIVAEFLKPGAGPPCQAYSLVGRVRSRGKAGYVPDASVARPGPGTLARTHHHVFSGSAKHSLR